MTVYANLENGVLKGQYDLLPKSSNGHENFHLKCAVDQNFMRENGFVKIIRDTTPFNPETHKMSDYLLYEVIDGEVYERRDILEIPKPSQEENTTE